MYNYVRSRQLEGTFPDGPDKGVWIISGLRIGRGWGMPREEDWPFDGHRENWPPAEPPEIDTAAKANRTIAYQRARTIDDCITLLAQSVPVLAAFELSIGEWRSAPNGEIPMPGPKTNLNGTHAVVLTGYNHKKRRLLLANSWGASWGDGGYGSIPYSYFERHHLEAWVIAARGTTRPEYNGSGHVEQCWGILDYLAETALHGIELFDATHDECVGWAFIVERQGYFDIEELFVRPQYRGKGHGRQLAIAIRQDPKFSAGGLRLWISHADAPMIKNVTTTKILSRLGLKPNRASRRWASYVAM
jgi:GNAT superfamily N-acetyltransferase